jgi:hypothetical protein
VAPPEVVLLDSGPLGLVSHPNAEMVNAEVVEWVGALLSAGVSVLIPEIADYEVRRVSAALLTTSICPFLNASSGVCPCRYGLGRTNQLAFASGEAWSARSISGSPSTTPSGPSGSNCQEGISRPPV